MGAFVGWANKLGVPNVGQRRTKLQRAGSRWCHGEWMFYVCGYDYIRSPSDEKFEGIRDVFLTESGPLGDSMNYCKRNTDPIAVTNMLSAYVAGSPMNIAVMARTLDYCSQNIQTNSSLSGAVSNGKGMEANAFRKLCSDLSQILSPYWGDELSKLGLTPLVPPSIGSKISKKFGQIKQQFDLLNINNVPSRPRSRRIGV